MTTKKSPPDEGGFGDFILACDDIVRTEACRLRRLGVKVDIDDAMQEGHQVLLECKDQIAANPLRTLARIIVRRRLLNVFVRDARAKQRHGTHVSLDELVDALDVGDGAGEERAIDQHTIDCVTVGSHEDALVERIAADEVGEFVEFLTAPPTRQARQQARKRWLPRMQKFATQEAA